MSSYDELIQKISEKVSSTKNHAYSSSDLTEITSALLNSPGQTIKKIVPSNGGQSYEEVETQPGDTYRAELGKMVVKEFGVSKEEAEKAKSMPITKDHAAALMGVAKASIGGYLDTGKKLTLDVTDPKSTKMSIQKVTLAEKTEATNKIVKNEDTGKYETVPTGKTIRTAERTALKASNTVPDYLKKEV